MNGCRKAFNTSYHDEIGEGWPDGKRWPFRLLSLRMMDLATPLWGKKEKERNVVT